MAKKDTFEKMYDLYNAIVDIDKIIHSPDDINQNGECKLDQILFYVRDIPKADYNPEISSQIIQCIRSAIVEMYNKTSQEITNDISSGASMGCRQDIHVPPRTSIPIFAHQPAADILGDTARRKNSMERGSVYAGSKTD